VTVVNPTPGGGSSNVVFFPVRVAWNPESFTVLDGWVHSSITVSKMGKHPRKRILAWLATKSGEIRIEGGLFLLVYKSRTFWRLLCEMISRLPESRDGSPTAS
jgi:hypothetical protein